MKAKYIFPCLGLMALALSSCDLDQMPQSQLNPENSFRTENELKLYINGLLTQMSGSTSETADNGVRLTLPDYMTGLRSSTISAGSWSWGNLRSVNIFFKYSGNCPDETVRLKYEAMARFLRAKFYYEKLKTFGGVPWYDIVLEDTSPELYNPRDTREFIADKILEDLDIALKSLPSDKSINTITRWSALALKSRFCLFEGTFRKYHGIADGDRFLRECEEASNELMNSGKFSIDMTGGPEYAYRDLFAQPVTNDASDTEVINAEAYNFSLGVKHGFNYALTNPAGNRMGFEKTFVNSYLMTDGTRFTDKPGYATMKFADEFKDRDPRMSQTIAGPGFTRVGQDEADSEVLRDAFTHSVTGYLPIKYYSAPIADAQNSNENDIIIYRLAEVMLNYAEAKAELGTLTQDDLERSITLIRKRVDMPALDMRAANADPDPYLASMYPAVGGANQGVILEIRRERRIELAMEGLRYDDIMRWKAGALFIPQFLGAYISGEGGYDLDGDGKNEIYVYKENRPPTPLLRGAKPLKLGLDIFLSEGDKGYRVVNTEISKSWNEDRDYLAPIPSRSLVLNPNLEQNPLWDAPGR